MAAMKSNDSQELKKKAGEIANTKSVGEARKSEADLKKEETKDKPLELC